jgi:hypothetical protein
MGRFGDENWERVGMAMGMFSSTKEAPGRGFPASVVAVALAMLVLGHGLVMAVTLRLPMDKFK